MRHIASAITALTLISASVAAAGPMNIQCCACVDLNSPSNQTAAIARFCVQSPPADFADLAEQCAQESGANELACTSPFPDTSCFASLSEIGIACPRPGVPAATGTTALALAAVLGAAGALALRRRRRADS